MNRIASAFTTADGSRKKAFIPFITAGDPDLATTERIILSMVDAGADLIEIGVPFSDPTAEGPVIQEANVRALAGGITTDDVFDLVARLRTQTQIPLVFMTYANVLFSYGLPRFAQRAAEVGLDGVILPDVPFEEKEEFAAPLAECGLELISLIAPTSHDRIQEIARSAQGFIYCVSSLGVTGVRSEITTDIGAMVALVREVTTVPVAVGFGISTPEQAARMAALSDGAIVGSAIVRIVAEHGSAAADPVHSYVADMANAVHTA